MSNLSAVLYSSGDLRVEDRDIPVPGPGQVQVAVQAIGICGSDVHYYQHGRIGSYVVEHPMVLGHESAGIVTAVGPGVDPARVGRHVALEPGVPCGACLQCRAGRYNLCADVAFFATPPVDGSIAQYVTIAADFAHPVPDGMTDAEAAMAEPVSVALWAARKAALTGGERVLVVGAGPIGLLCGQVARALGAGGVTVTDVNDYRLSVAAELGLGTARADRLPAPGFEVVIECSGSAQALRAAMPLAAPAGRVVLVGMGADEVTVDVALIQTRELWITGTFRYVNTYPTALGLIASGAVDVGRIMTHEFPLARTEEALNAARTHPDALKAVVKPWM